MSEQLVSSQIEAARTQIEVALHGFDPEIKRSVIANMFLTTFQGELTSDLDLTDRLIAVTRRQLQDRENSPKDYEKIAAEVAREVRDLGMGLILGGFGPAFATNEDTFYGPKDGHNYGKGFFRGTNISGRANEQLAIFIGASFPRLDNIDPSTHKWEIAEVNRMVKTWKENKVVVPGGIFKKPQYEEVTKTERSPYLVGDEMNGWIRYSLLGRQIQPTDHRDMGYSFSILVPSQLSGKIDKAVSDSPFFPDLLIKAIYPSLIGTDRTKNFCRYPADKITIIDKRGDASKPEIVTRSYPHPLSY